MTSVPTIAVQQHAVDLDIHVYEGQANVTESTAADDLYAMVGRVVTTMIVLAVGSIFVSFWWDITAFLGLAGFFVFVGGIAIIAAQKKIAQQGLDEDAFARSMGHTWPDSD